MCVTRPITYIRDQTLLRRGTLQGTQHIYFHHILGFYTIGHKDLWHQCLYYCICMSIEIAVFLRVLGLWCFSAVFPNHSINGRGDQSPLCFCTPLDSCCRFSPWMSVSGTRAHRETPHHCPSLHKDRKHLSGQIHQRDEQLRDHLAASQALSITHTANLFQLYFHTQQGRAAGLQHD